MAKGKKNENILYRAVRFEIFPNLNEVALLYAVSSNLTRVWNEALVCRQGNFEQFIKPFYEKIKAANGDAQKKKEISLQLKEAFKKHSVTLFDQINELTQKRANDLLFREVPRNWQEETLDSLNASFSSWMALRKNNDLDAKPPRERNIGDWFYKIPGRMGFKLVGEEIHISFRELGYVLVCPVPQYDLEKLARAKRLKKFEIYRTERDLTKSGRFFLSVAYEIPKPKEIASSPDNTVYLAIGASRLGIVSSKGSFCWNLPRPDFYWKGESMIPAVEERIANCQKGSRKWKKRTQARAKMFAKLGAQQKQHGQYEVVEKLLGYGIHFVVTDLKVRSKAGALADASQPQRGGAPFGPNWSAQNTGNIANLVAKLTEKAKEHGGTVVKRQPPELSQKEENLPEDQRKILIARKLREEFLADKK